MLEFSRQLRRRRAAADYWYAAKGCFHDGGAIITEFRFDFLE
jgi:hypothetical protein